MYAVRASAGLFREEYLLFIVVRLREGRNNMTKSIKRLLACFLIAAMLVGMTSFTSAEAALAKPGHCHFSSWTNTSFTSCKIKWNSVAGANSYTLVVTYTDGSHYKQYKTSSTSYTLKNLADNHIYIAKVRATYVDPITGQITSQSEFSNITFIVPLPRKLSITISNDSKIQAKLEWNPIYGCNGYNIFMTNEPLSKNKWVWNQSTAVKANATSATIKKFKGQNLKRYTNYYVRIVTRRKRNGVFCGVPVPDDYCNAGFQMMYIR